MGAGGGKKTVNTVTAVFNAAKHAYGALKGFYNTFKSVWDTFKKVYDEIKQVYDKITNWAKSEFGWLWKAYNTLKDLYDNHVKPILGALQNGLKTLEAMIKAVRGEVLEALIALDEKTFGWIKDLYGKIDHIFSYAQNIASLFSSRLAQRIGRFRQDLRDSIIGPINKLEQQLIGVYWTLDEKIFKYVDAILTWGQRLVVFDINALKVIFQDLDRQMYPDGKPKLSYQLKTTRYWGEAVITYQGALSPSRYRLEADDVKGLITRRPPGTENPIVPELWRDPSVPEGVKGVLWIASEMEKPDWGRASIGLAMLRKYVGDDVLNMLGLDPRRGEMRMQDLAERYHPARLEGVTREEVEQLPYLLGEEQQRRKLPNPPQPPGKTKETTSRWRPTYDEIVKHIEDLEDAVYELLDLIAQVQENVTEIMEKLDEQEWHL